MSKLIRLICSFLWNDYYAVLERYDTVFLELELAKVKLKTLKEECIVYRHKPIQNDEVYFKGGEIIEYSTDYSINAAKNLGEIPKRYALWKMED